MNSASELVVQTFTIYSIQYCTVHAADMLQASMKLYVHELASELVIQTFTVYSIQYSTCYSHDTDLNEIVRS